MSIKYTECLAEAGIEPSVGSVGDSYDNALDEAINGLYKAEVIHRRDRGAPSRRPSSLRWNAPTGSTIAGCWSPLATSRRPKQKHATTPCRRNPPGQRDSNEKASGIPGAVQGHKARRQMCPLYVSGLIGPGDRKSVQPMAERVALGEYAGDAGIAAVSARELERLMSKQHHSKPISSDRADDRQRYAMGPRPRRDRSRLVGVCDPR